MFPCWSPWCSHSHPASALSHYTSYAVSRVPVEKTRHLPHHRLPEAPREGHGLAGAQPNPPANSEPPLTRSPAVGAVPAHSFKLMVPAQDPRTVGVLRGNFTWKVMNPQAMQRSKQTKRLEHLVWLTLEVSGRQ